MYYVPRIPGVGGDGLYRALAALYSDCGILLWPNAGDAARRHTHLWRGWWKSAMVSSFEAASGAVFHVLGRGRLVDDCVGDENC